MGIPTVKVMPITTTVATANRQDHSPVDLRWMRVEEFLRSRELRPNSKKAYQREFKAFLGWTEKGWQDITTRDMDRYKEWLKTTPSARGMQRSAATINLSLSALQSLFKWLCARDYIAKDPMMLIEKPKLDPVTSDEWMPEEVQALLSATEYRPETERRDLAILWILLHGLRAREVEALNVGDFDGKRVHIHEAKDDSVGQVPLLPDAISAVEALLKERREQGDLLNDESPLFVSASNNNLGQRLSYWGIYNLVKELAKLSGVRKANPHMGRHTIATTMVLRGMDPLLARQITRHKSERSFERYSKNALVRKAEEQFLRVMEQE